MERKYAKYAQSGGWCCAALLVIDGDIGVKDG